jgi:hypothetical protein
VATFRDGIVNHPKVDALARAPSRQMRFRRNFTKAGDCASQFHPDQILHCGRDPTNARPPWAPVGSVLGVAMNAGVYLANPGKQ